MLYRTYIRPYTYLEYCAPSWRLYLAKDIDTLEREQHRATKLVKSLAILYPMKTDLSLFSYNHFTVVNNVAIETYKINVQTGTILLP